MANVAFTISPAPGIINDMIAVLYDGAAEIDRLPIPAPHTSPQDLDFINVAPKTYNVKIHETPGGGVLGNLRHDFWVDAALEKLKAYTVKTFQVGLGRGTPYFDPADQGTNYINPDLVGLDYMVFKPGYGPLDWNADITPRIDGGFTFTNNQKFGQDEIYTILISNLVTQPITGGSVQGFPTGFVAVSADRAFDSTLYNKIIEIDTSQDILTINIDLSPIPDGTQFSINTHRHYSNLNNAILALGVGQFCLVNGRDENIVYIGRSEEVVFFKTSQGLKVLNWDGEYRRVGEKIFTDYEPPTIVNILPFIGNWVEKVKHPRLWFWYVARLAPDQFWTGADDSTPVGDDVRRWGVGPSKIFVPDYKNMGYKVNDGTKVDNEYEADAVGPGQVKVQLFTGQGILKTGSHGGGVGALASYGDGGFITTDSASGTSNNAVRTDPWDLISPAGENRVKTVAVRAYVII